VGKWTWNTLGYLAFTRWVLMPGALGKMFVDFLNNIGLLNTLVTWAILNVYYVLLFF
jgi:hypothetical protein